MRLKHLMSAGDETVEQVHRIASALNKPVAILSEEKGYELYTEETCEE